ncbi:MAG TPA: MFS transporter [Clostridiales bacterium]|nr:MFS transporter [Clostridiales bacterium]
MSKSKALNRWFVLFILAIACGQIYQLPYLRYSYYDQMITAFAVNNTQLGTFMTAFGLGSLVCYLIGGVLAMKVSDKILLPTGMILTGAAGLWFATFPSYGIALFISFFWAFSTSLIFWPAVINFIRGLGTSAEQGRLYGLFEGLRGLTATAIGLVIVAIFNAAMSQMAGLRTVILTYAIIAIILGIIVFFIVPNNKEEKKALAAASNQSSLFAGFGQALKLPITWICAGIVFFTMMVFDCLGYTTPYLTGCLGASAAFAAAFGTIRTWGLQVVGGTTGGIIADKIGSSAKTLIGGFTVIAAGFVILNLLPVKSSMVWPAAIFILVFGAAIYVNRGVYFAVLDEAKVPANINAAVIGIVSAIGFTPDAFIYTVIGHFLDTYPGVTGYHITYWMGAICGVCGIICAIIAVKVVKKSKMQST